MPRAMPVLGVDIEFMDRVRKKLMMVANRIRHATHGYSGFFDRIKIDEEELYRLYKYDLELIEVATRIRDSSRELERLLGERGRLLSALMKIDEQAAHLDKLALERDRMFKMEGG